MKYSLTFFLVLYGAIAFGQCNPTITPQTIFYPNTTSTHTSQPSPHYLCGPNTVLWDTINAQLKVYCNASTTLNIKSALAIVNMVWLKSGAVINVLQTPIDVLLNYKLEIY